MNRSIELNSTNAEAYSQLGEWYFSQNKFALAAEVFRNASKNCKNGDRQFAKPLTKCLIYSGLADSALFLINRYYNNRDSITWNKLRAQAFFVRKAMAHSTVKWPVSLGSYINTKYPEIFPCLTKDSTELYFTRRVKNMDEDFFEARYDTSCKVWLAGENMGAPPNTIDNDCSQFISADGHYLFFCRSDNRSENGWAEGGYDLFMAYRVAVDSAWTVPQYFGATINTPGYEGMPCLSPDNKTLYFVSDRPGGYGGLDIWASDFEDNLWQAPRNLGPQINSTGDETAPFIALDDETLFFTSNGRLGMGGSDIFVSKKINDSVWKDAQNLGYPINTAYNEESEWVTSAGSKMIFASDRQGPAGNFDLYEAELPYNLHPSSVSYLKGYIYDSISKVRLNSAPILIIKRSTGDTLYHLSSNRGDASYSIPLVANTEYVMHTWMIGHTDVDDTFWFCKNQQTTEMVHNVSMLPLDYVTPISDSLIATIHFDINKVELTDSDNVLIGKGIAPFLQDKNIVLYVNGFTDNTGNPMLNEELSTKRANIVATALVKLGIDDLNIIAKGWGEAKMIAPNDTEENQRKNRRVEIFLKRE